MRLLTMIYVTLIASPCLAGPGGVKSVFLNGVDISSARSQELKNVDVLINEQGDIFLLAPHYQVNEEDTYVPLSKYAQGLGPVTHKAPQAMQGNGKKAQGKETSGGAKAKSAEGSGSQLDKGSATAGKSASESASDTATKDTSMNGGEAASGAANAPARGDAAGSPLETQGKDATSSENEAKDGETTTP